MPKHSEKDHYFFRGDRHMWSSQNGDSQSNFPKKECEVGIEIVVVEHLAVTTDSVN